MKALIYVRVSSEEQVSNTSLKNQEDTCRRWCEREGYEVSEVFRDEGESAKTKTRPGLLEALDYARKNQADAFVVWKVDRLSRNQLDFHNLRALLIGFGTRVQSATETLTDDPAGKLMEGVLAAFAQFDNDLRAERTRAALQVLARAGGYVSEAPVGYLNSRTPDGAPSLMIDTERGSLVKRGFELVASGDYTQVEALAYINGRGLRTRRGNELTKQTWSHVLRNAVYAGTLESDLVGLEPIKGNWDPLVSEDVFQQVQAAIRRRERLPQEVAHADFPLRGFVRCGGCDRPLTGSWSTGRSKKYAYYHCTKCGAVRAKKAALEIAFFELLQQLRLKQSYTRLFKAAVTDVWKQRLETVSEETKAQRKQVQRLEAKRQRLLDLLEEGVIDTETYKQRAAKVRTELTLAGIDERATEAESLDIEAVLEFAEQILLEPLKLWLNASQAQKRRLFKLLFPSGLTWQSGEFGTVATCCVLEDLQATTAPLSHVGCHKSWDWNLIVAWFRRVDALRQAS